jgi:REP element-mobilizing transposase RayT
MTYWRLHYHLIWSTADRQPLLTPENEKLFYGVLYGKAKELGLKVHAAGNVEDHVHVVVSIPPTLSVADCVRHIKGASAYAINHLPNSDGKFKWQAGYGALSFSDSLLEVVAAYAAKQKEHHKQQTVRSLYEKVEDEDRIDDPIHQSAGLLYSQDDSLTEALLDEHKAERRDA